MPLTRDQIEQRNVMSVDTLKMQDIGRIADSLENIEVLLSEVLSQKRDGGNIAGGSQFGSGPL